MNVPLVEIGPVQISIDRLIEAVWHAVQSERISNGEFSQRHAEKLEQAAKVVWTRLYSHSSTEDV